MNGWTLARLDQLGKVERGRSRHRPRNDPALYGGPYPFVQTGDVKAAGLRLYDYTQTYSEVGFAQSRLWPAGTLCITIAANIGDTAILGIPACFPDSIVGFTAYPDRADTVFVKYALDYAKLKFTAISRGATQDNLSLEKLLSQDLLVPPLPTQRRIASILGAYDDLIEVNRRRIKVLEEMARGLFEEWFVRFRFPGHENVPILDTPDGPLPEGWHMGTLAELADLGGTSINPGKSPERIFAHFSLPAFDVDRQPLIEPGEAIRSNKLLFAAPAVLVSKLNPRIPRVWYVPEATGHPQVASTEFVPLIAKSSCGPAWLYAAVHNQEFSGRLTSIAGGTSTSHQRVKPKDILNTPVVVPDKRTSQCTNDILAPIFQMAHNLEVSSVGLATSRDLLLPRLISGQLSVEAGEKIAEAAE